MTLFLFINKSLTNDSAFLHIVQVLLYIKMLVIHHQSINLSVGFFNPYQLFQSKKFIRSHNSPDFWLNPNILALHVILSHIGLDHRQLNFIVFIALPYSNDINIRNMEYFIYVQEDTCHFYCNSPLIWLHLIHQTKSFCLWRFLSFCCGDISLRINFIPKTFS